MKSGQPVEPGDVVDGKYRIESKIGSGGMAVVYSARHLRLDERVALKFLDPKLRASAEAKERFQHEAKAAFSLRSEHVARVLDVGELSAETPYIVMELLEGDTLAKWVEDNGKPSLANALHITAQACEGVAEAHARGIVHRDIKPENLFVTPRAGQPPLLRVLDFGISKAILGESELTGTNDLIGTPLYMAPEQFSHAKNADARADVWSLGIILYWLVTGTTPFDAPTPMGVMSAILTRKPVGPSQSDGRVPRGLDDVILRCLVQERGARYANAGELGKAIAPFIARVEIAEARGDREGAGPPSSVTEPRRQMSTAPPRANANANANANASSTFEDMPTQADLNPPAAMPPPMEEVTIPTRDRVVVDERPSGKTAVLRPTPLPQAPQELLSPRTQRLGSQPNLVPPRQDAYGAQTPRRAPGPFASTQPMQRPSQTDPNPQRVSLPPPQAVVQWQNAQHAQNAQNAKPPVAPSDDDERRKMIIAVMLTFIVIMLGLIVGLVVRACNHPAPHPVG